MERETKYNSEKGRMNNKFNKKPDIRMRVILSFIFIYFFLQGRFKIMTSKSPFLRGNYPLRNLRNKGVQKMM